MHTNESIDRSTWFLERKNERKEIETTLCLLMGNHIIHEEIMRLKEKEHTLEHSNEYILKRIEELRQKIQNILDNTL